MTPNGIEPATFRFVAQHLNHCVTAVPTSRYVALLIFDHIHNTYVTLTLYAYYCHFSYVMIVSTYIQLRRFFVLVHHICAHVALKERTQQKHRLFPSLNTARNVVSDIGIKTPLFQHPNAVLVLCKGEALYV